MVCEAPIVRGPNKGQPATGTDAGYMRHLRAEEPACDECRVAQRERSRLWKAANPEQRRENDRRYREHNREKVREASRRFAAKNREAERERNRRYRAANPRKSGPPERERARRWYYANRERALESRRLYRTANRDRAREDQRRWHDANPGKAQEYKRRRRARKAAGPIIPFTVEQLAQRMAYWGNRCWMCGGAYEAVDHVKPLAAGGPHVLANLRPACALCNAVKGARWPLEPASK